MNIPVRWMVTRGCWHWVLDLWNLPMFYVTRRRITSKIFFIYVMLEQWLSFFAKSFFLFCMLFRASFTKLLGLTWEVHFLPMHFLTVLLGFHHISLHRTKRACQQVYYNDFFYLISFFHCWNWPCWILLGTWFYCSRYQL